MSTQQSSSWIGGNRMGLYLCIFDGDDEVASVEVGSYEDFGVFREMVLDLVESGDFASVCPILMDHSDADGEWSVENCSGLVAELDTIASVFAQHEAISWPAEKWQSALLSGAKPKNLLESFIDVEGGILVFQLRALAECAVDLKLAVLFQ